MLRVTASVRNKKGKVIVRTAVGDQDGEVESIKQVGEDLRRQLKASEAALKAQRSGYRRKGKSDD